MFKRELFCAITVTAAAMVANYLFAESVATARGVTTLASMASTAIAGCCWFAWWNAGNAADKRDMQEQINELHEERISYGESLHRRSNTNIKVVVDRERRPASH